MKRGCLIIFVVFLVVVIVGGVVVYLQLNSSYGLSESEPVSYTGLMNEDTRLQAVIYTDKAIPLIQSLLPATLEGNLGKLPWGPAEAAEKVLPREVAILAGGNYAKNQIDVTVFANEKRLGPALVEGLNQQNPLAGIQMVNWSSAGYTLPERGALSIVGAIPLQGNEEDQILDLFPPKGMEVVAPVSKTHFLEIQLDNRDGDLLLLSMVGAQQMGIPADMVFMDETVVGVLTHITDMWVTADITGHDELLVHFMVRTAEDTEFAQRMALIGAVNGFMIPEIQRRASAYGIEVKLFKDLQPDFDGNNLLGGLLVTGWRGMLEQQVDQVLQQLNRL